LVVRDGRLPLLDPQVMDQVIDRYLALAPDIDYVSIR